MSNTEKLVRKIEKQTEDPNVWVPIEWSDVKAGMVLRTFEPDDGSPVAMFRAAEDAVQEDGVWGVEADLLP